MLSFRDEQQQTGTGFCTSQRYHGNKQIPSAKSEKGRTPISPSHPHSPSISPPLLMHPVHNPRLTTKPCACACFQGAALAGDRDGAVHRHVLPPRPSQRHEGLSAAAGTVKPMSCSAPNPTCQPMRADEHSPHAGKVKAGCSQPDSEPRNQRVDDASFQQDRQAQSSVTAAPHRRH